MKRVIMTLSLAALVGMSSSAYAMKLSGEEPTYSKVYKPTKSAVKKTMDKMGVPFEVDSDGDLVYEIDGKGWSSYVIFSYAGKAKVLWNVQMRAQFGTKANRYDELVEFANEWNATKKVPKIAMKDRDSMVVSMNYPVQYGFNPDEFEENVFDMFNRTVKQIGEKTDAMRR